MTVLPFHRPGDAPIDEEQVYRALLESLDSLYSTARRLSGGADVAEDLVQETARKALQAASALRDHRNLRAWLFRILVNVLRDHLRRARLEKSALEAEPDLEAIPELETISRSTAEDVRRAFETLAPDLQAVILLVDIEEFTIAEAAGILTIPMGTAASRLARAHGRLRGLLRQYESRPAQSTRLP